MSADEAMLEPYRRSFFTSIALMVGAAALQKTGEPFFSLVLLVVMKIGLDGYAHSQQPCAAPKPTPSHTPPCGKYPR